MVVPDTHSFGAASAVVPSLFDFKFLDFLIQLLGQVF